MSVTLIPSVSTIYMKRLKTFTGKTTEHDFDFEGEIGTFKSFIEDFCSSFSETDTIKFYGDIDGKVYAEIKSYDVESDEAYANRALKKKSEIEQSIEKLHEELKVLEGLSNEN